MARSFATSQRKDGSHYAHPISGGGIKQYGSLKPTHHHRRSTKQRGTQLSLDSERMKAVKPIDQWSAPAPQAPAATPPPSKVMTPDDLDFQVWEEQRKFIKSRSEDKWTPQQKEMMGWTFDEWKRRTNDASKEYNDKMAARVNRYRDLAAKAKAESQAAYEQSTKMGDLIPFGQPILVGHYSERADRNFRNKIIRKMDQSVELGKKAEYYENKADSAENPYAIRADDPAALLKLKQKVNDLEEARQKLKDTPADEYFKGKWHDNAFTYEYQKKLELESLGRRVRDAKKRVDEINVTKSIASGTRKIGNVEMVVDQSDNRVKLHFPSIPLQETRTELKRNGWHWSPSNQAWQRQISNSAIYSAETILKKQGGGAAG